MPQFSAGRQQEGAADASALGQVAAGERGGSSRAMGYAGKQRKGAADASGLCRVARRIPQGNAGEQWERVADLQSGRACGRCFSAMQGGRRRAQRMPQR